MLGTKPSEKRKNHCPKNITRNVGKLVAGVVIACCLTSVVHAQTTTTSATSLKPEQIEDRRARARASAEESRKYLEEITAKMIAESAERAKLRPQLTPEQQAAQQAAASAAAEQVWQQKVEAAQPFMRSLIAEGQESSEEKRQEGEAEFAKLRQQAAVSEAEQSAKEVMLEVLAEALQVPREIQTDEGRKLIFTGEIAGSPTYIGSFNSVAAAGISADELWPAGTWPYSETNSGLNLTGTNVALALWEVDGGVRTNHQEFGPRVKQRDAAALDPSGHATEVAGTMAASGVGTFSGVFAEGRGVAYQANVSAYNTASFKTERESAAAGDATNAPVFVGNHSWGLINGWHRQTITNQSNVVVTNAWTWYGPASASFPEDFKFGFYTPADQFDTGCSQIDLFHQAEATRHLMVYACGNDRLQGPTNSPGTYYRLSGGVFVADTTTRDWLDGDDGGYDSVSAPGTAKNILTVGACEDVYYVTNSLIFFGFGPSANAVPADFSGAGPTDDGRLKPDLAAVGTPNAALRNALGQVSGGVPLGLISPTVAAVNQYNLVSRGTSFAAPGVSGAFGLVLQRRAQLFPGLPASEAWRSSTLKAIAIDTCDDVGAAGPDYRLGYGILNAKRAVERVGQDYGWGRGSLIKEFTLSPTQSVSFVFTSSGTQPLSITAAWSDPPGPALTNITSADMTNPMLVNNIDIVVEQLSNGTLFRPWILNPDLTNKTSAARSAAATRGVDNRNNVEQVSIATPTSGQYRITVTHSGGLSGNPAPSTQTVSVVIGGMTPPAPVITGLDKSPGTNQFLLTFAADPGAYFTSSTNLVNWTTNGSVLAASNTNTVSLTSNDPNRFWRLRRGQ